MFLEGFHLLGQNCNGWRWMSRLAGNLQKFRLTVSILSYTCLIGKPNMGAYSGREMYCHSVITVKTEYSIRKFVSAKRSPKRVVQLAFILGRLLVSLVTNLSYWTLKWNRSFLNSRLSVTESNSHPVLPDVWKRLARKAKFAYGLQKRYHNLCKW